MSREKERDCFQIKNERENSIVSCYRLCSVLSSPQLTENQEPDSAEESGLVYVTRMGLVDKIDRSGGDEACKARVRRQQDQGCRLWSIELFKFQFLFINIFMCFCRLVRSRSGPSLGPTTEEQQEHC